MMNSCHFQWNDLFHKFLRNAAIALISRDILILEHTEANNIVFKSINHQNNARTKNYDEFLQF
jgi:hypothetical protein